MRGVQSASYQSLAVLFCLGAAALAGCTDEAPTPKDVDGVGKVAFDDPAAILVEGVVVNDELAPVAEAQVTLSPTEQTTLTDEGGMFRFAVLEPGTYTISAYKDFHIEASQEVRVTADDLTGVQIVLAPTPDGIPYHTTEVYASYAFCHGPIGGGCFIVNTVLATNYLPEDRPDFGYVIPENGFKELRFEAEWAGNYAAEGGFIARNPDGLFLGCNNTDGQLANPVTGGGGKEYEPTKRYYAGPDGGESVPSPSQFWVQANHLNAEVGACHDMPSEKGDQLWQTVRIGGESPSPFALNTRAEVYLTFFFWAKAEDRAFSVLEE